jgi:hypothetical protein
MAKPELLLTYHSSSGTPLIDIPESRKLRHSSGILGSIAACAGRGFLSRMSSLVIYEANFHKLKVIMDVIIPAQAPLNSNK